jgi:hypothetical protein
MLTTHFYLMPRVKLSGAISLLPLYAFMEWRRKDYSYQHNSTASLIVVKTLCNGQAHNHDSIASEGEICVFTKESSPNLGITQPPT